MHGERAGDRPFGAIAEAIWAAPPHDLPAVAADLFARHADVTAEILLVDYRQAFLVRTLPDGDRAPGDDVPVDNTPQGRAFAAQETVREDGGRLVHLPLGVQGERLGVLSARLPPEGAPPWLDDAAALLARALKIADQGTDLYRRLRRRARLTVAAEMQWELLPALSRDAAGFRFAGQLEPAYRVWGDCFDWSASSERLTVTVGNGMGSGTRAAALSHLAVSALRNARRSGGDLAEQAALADETLFARHRGERHVATLLLDVELATGRVQVIDAGSPQIYRLRGGAADRIGFEEQMPLGMFGDTRYAIEELTVEPGDRLVVVSDGVHAARSPGGVPYGDSALPRALRATRLQSPPEAVRTMIRSYVEYHEGTEPADDAVVVCVDWPGPPDLSAGA